MSLLRYIDLIYLCVMTKRADILEFAVLGMLGDGPLHGYELRKRLDTVLGPFRTLSFGSLYPCLRRIEQRGLITQVTITPAIDSNAPALSGKRARVVYSLTGEGKEAFEHWVNEAGPEAWEDEGFAAHLAFFGRTEARVRVRILEGRRSRLEERVAMLRESMKRQRESVDAYTLELQNHGLDRAEHEVRWLNELITTERKNAEVAQQSSTA